MRELTVNEVLLSGFRWEEGARVDVRTVKKESSPLKTFDDFLKEETKRLEQLDKEKYRNGE